VLWKLETWLLAVAAGVATTLLASSCSAPLAIIWRPPVTLATANPASLYYSVGNAICRIVNLADADDPAKRCRAIASDGAGQNLEKVRNGEATLGLTRSDLAYGAFRGEGSFAEIGPHPELRTVIALQSESFTVLARADSGIRDFQDLRGRRVGIGKVGAGYSFTRDVVLGFYGWKISDFDRALELGPAEQNQTLCNNEVDAIIFEAAHPDGLTREAATECRTRLVRVAGPPISRFLATHRYYVASVIPGGMYDGNPENTPTFGTRTLLITSARQRDDLAYAVVKAVFENFADFRRLHPTLSTLTRRDLVPSEAVMPIHPGALRYYREAALLP
jgi:hypothetical protein